LPELRPNCVPALGVTMEGEGRGGKKIQGPKKDSATKVLWKKEQGKKGSSDRVKERCHGKRGRSATEQPDKLERENWVIWGGVCHRKGGGEAQTLWGGRKWLRRGRGLQNREESPQKMGGGPADERNKGKSKVKECEKGMFQMGGQWQEGGAPHIHVVLNKGATVRTRRN